MRCALLAGLIGLIIGGSAVWVITNTTITSANQKYNTLKAYYDDCVSELSSTKAELETLKSNYEDAVNAYRDCESSYESCLATLSEKRKEAELAKEFAYVLNNAAIAVSQTTLHYILYTYYGQDVVLNCDAYEYFETYLNDYRNFLLDNMRELEKYGIPHTYFDYKGEIESITTIKNWLYELKDICAQIR